MISKVQGEGLFNTNYYATAVYDLKGKKVFDSNYEELSFHCYGTFQTSDISSNRGLINSKGIEIAPNKYYVVQIMRYPLMEIEDSNMKWGYMNHEGEIIIPCIYTDAKPFVQGLAQVFTGGTYFKFLDYKPGVKMSYINMNGKIIWQE